MPDTRLARARAEITRRRGIAQCVEHFRSPWRSVASDDNGGAVGYQCSDPDGGLVCETPDYGTYVLPDFIAENDPAHVLAVLAAADAALDRHTPHQCPFVDCGRKGAVCDTCDDEHDYRNAGHCPDAAAVLDLYAPEPT